MELDGVEQSRDSIAILMEEKLENMHPSAPESSIHRIPKQLLHMNDNAYTPRVISIGPFHHDKHNFKAIEDLKFRFFNIYRCRIRDMISVQDIVKKARGWEKRAREYYSEPINMESEEFVKMMVLDGSFIVEFLIMHSRDIFPTNENKVHSSFYKAIHYGIMVDLIMLENQLPFFVLQGLFDLILPTASFDSIHKSQLFGESCDSIDFSFELLVHAFANDILPIKTNLFPSHMLNIQKPRHLVDFLSFYFVPLENKKYIEDQWYHPPSATQLHEAGVVFKKVEEKERCIMNISFKNGILKIPTLLIDDAFEVCARNQLAFGQYICKENIETMNENVTHYFEFLDDLISTDKDVNLLVKKGIIINSIGGSDKEISQLVNDLCKNIMKTSTSYFNDVAKDLKRYCERKRNKWMASLRRNYFHNPWTLISFLAAAFLIVLTLLQTVFTAISTFK